MEVDAPVSAAKSTRSQRKRKKSTSPPVDVEVGCFDLLKKLSCSVQCGGKTLSIKETMPPSSSSSETLVPEEQKHAIKRKKPDNASKVTLKRKHSSRSSLPETDKKANEVLDQHQSFA